MWVASLTHSCALLRPAFTYCVHDSHATQEICLVVVKMTASESSRLPCSRRSGLPLTLTLTLDVTSPGPVAGSVLKLMAPHFPATAPAAKPSPTLLASLTTLNLQVRDEP